MKILHYLFGLPPVRKGGVPVYALDLMEGQVKLGMQVEMLIPGPILISSNRVEIKSRKNWKDIPCNRIINPLYIPNAYGINEPDQFMKKVSVDSYLNWFNEAEINIIHVHSLLGIHLEFFKAAEQMKIPIIYTTHDFFGLCPKIDMLKDNMTCDEKDWQQCMTCCSNAYSLRRLWLEQTDLYGVYCKHPFLMEAVHWKGLAGLKDFIRKSGRKHNTSVSDIQEVKEKGEKSEGYIELMKYYRKMFEMIDCYLYNSNQTREIFLEKLGYKYGKILPVMNKGIYDRRKRRSFGKTLRLGYLGSQFEFKGYHFLLGELNRLSDSGRRDFYLNTYIVGEHEEMAYVKNHKPFSREQQEEVFDDMDLLIVPSICRETFGMVVLEAFSVGIPVLVSENVGAKMLIENNSGCGKIFSFQKNHFLDTLIGIYDDRKELDLMNQSILKSNLNLDYMEHVNEVLNVYKEYV